MPQHDYILDNAPGASFRSDTNGALAAVVSQNSDTAAPSTTYAYMTWADTTTGILKVRNAANSAWVSVYTLATGAPILNTASDIVNTPAGDIEATDVQAAIDELDTEKASLAGATFTGQVSISTFFGVSDAGELTLATDAVTVTGSRHTIDTESDGATDDLSTINGGVVGNILILSAADSTRDVVVKNGVGNISLSADFTMDHVDDRLVLMYEGTTWFELSRSDNGV